MLAQCDGNFELEYTYPICRMNILRLLEKRNSFIFLNRKMSITYIPFPQSEELTSREKGDAMGAYLMMFAAFAVSLPLQIINLIAAIIYFNINRTKSRYIHFHCLQSLLYQLPTTLINWGILLWVLQIFLSNNLEVNDYFYAYLGFIILANLIYFTFIIVAAIRARKGIFMYFIFFGSFAYNRVYSSKNTLFNYNEESHEKTTK